MMKKILRMLLLGFLTVTVLSPSVVTAEEDQTGQLPSSSAYSEIDGIAPMDVPGSKTKTIENGQSHDFTWKTIIFPNKATYSKVTGTSERCLFSLQLVHNIELPEGSQPRPVNKPTYYDTGMNGVEEKWSHSSSKITTPTVVEIGFRITNYDAGPVTFTIEGLFTTNPLW